MEGRRMRRLIGPIGSLVLLASVAIAPQTLATRATGAVVTGAPGSPSFCQRLAFMLEEHGYDVERRLPAACTAAGSPGFCQRLTFTLEEHGYDVDRRLPARCD